MATLNLKKKKFIDEDALKKIVAIGINFGERLNSIETSLISEYDSTKTYIIGEACYHDNYIYKCKSTATGEWNPDRWQLIGDDITELTLDEIKAMLGLTTEQLTTLSSIILDSEVRLDKTYSSSKIYTSIQNAIDTAKTYTLTELGKISGASYKIASSTSDMTDEKVIYLLQNGSTYDMYIVDSGTPTRIGDVSIDLSDYYTKSEIDNDFLKKTDATSTYATITGLDNHISDTVAHMTQTEKDNIVKKDDIATTINSTSTDSEVPSSKAVYDNCIKDNNLKTYTKLEQLGLVSGCTVEDIYNALPNNSYFECGTNTIYASSPYTLYVINNLPNQSGGLLTIRKYASMRNDIQYRTSNGNGTMTDLYIATFKGIDASGLTWKRVCTTSVEDIPKTTITFTDETKYKVIDTSLNYYYVKNGICYVQLYVRCLEVATTYTEMALNLPVSNTSMISSCSPWGDYSSLTTSINSIGYNMSGNRLFLCFGSVGMPYLLQFSYPVAES